MVPVRELNANTLLPFRHLRIEDVNEVLCLPANLLEDQDGNLASTTDPSADVPVDVELPRVCAINVVHANLSRSACEYREFCIQLVTHLQE
jgi:hypothetical protein